MDSALKCPGLEQSLATKPEIFQCLHCGGEVEIWTDENQARCSGCGRSVGRAFIKGLKEKGSEKKYHVEVQSFEEETRQLGYYEWHEALIVTGDIVQAEQYKMACQSCHKFGKNLACPPYSPGFSEYVNGRAYAKILCVRMPQEYFREDGLEGAYRKPFRKARAILVDELLKYRRRGFLVAGSGFCLACERCRVEEGGTTCLKPQKLIYSLESLGVNLTALVKGCFDFELEWSAGEHSAAYVCSIGAVFFEEEGLAA